MSEKTYKVVGETLVHGFKKGETFVANLLEHEEDLLVRGGHVEVVGSKTAPTPVVSSTVVAGGSVAAAS
jgi:hypothetical protein